MDGWIQLGTQLAAAVNYLGVLCVGSLFGSISNLKRLEERSRTRFAQHQRGGAGMRSDATVRTLLIPSFGDDASWGSPELHAGPGSVLLVKNVQTFCSKSSDIFNKASSSSSSSSFPLNSGLTSKGYFGWHNTHWVHMSNTTSPVFYRQRVLQVFHIPAVYASVSQ